jgi:hypothetical protein
MRSHLDAGQFRGPKLDASLQGARESVQENRIIYSVSMLCAD